ncbi:alanyl-tRNA editing protein [Staphylococcus nepalensis]|uniref:Alanyl-tRNA synthetase n=2 Tax=Staphylococcus nepalensis TaxID=214473 RepID=A0A380GHB4_9STAP|nr:alanyl-tRNA editing protein [Staphylococcus nepalensis]GGB90245.1 alanyl-tRNA editing protein AlaX [Staphylococcus nepalensis]SUM53816.1 alanyl-tRNA synthetase [Staphylococcus nepalensis]VDG65740.1 Alanyl-tRNA synthetase, class IIc-like protein [Lacrimispora indolis]
MTEELYISKSYQTNCNINIISISKDRRSIIIDKTIFYPGGGGQPKDIGYIAHKGNQYVIENIELDQNNQYIYKLSHPLPKDNSQLTMHIDWEHRYKNMRYHTLLHLISGYFYSTYGALATSSQIEKDYARLEIAFSEDCLPEQLDKEQLKNKIEDLITHEIPVNIEYAKRKDIYENNELIRTYTNLIPEQINTIRLIKIKGIDKQACAGTHVSNIKEIGSFQVEQLKNKGRLKKRIKVAIT